MQKYTYLCWIHTDTMNNRRRKTSLAKYIPLTLFVRVRKGLIKVCVSEGVGDRTELKYFDPKLSRCVFLVLLMLNRGSGVHSAGCWFSLLHLISIFSGPQFIRAPSPFGLVWLSLPHLVSNLAANPLAAACRTQHNCNSTGTGRRTQLNSPELN